jgi:hypothetical protein
MKKKAVLFVFILAALAACSQSPAAPTPDVSAIYTQAAGTVLASANRTQTAGRMQTEAAKPTPTKLPTLTPMPTATNTPLPQPISFQGTGDSVVDVVKWRGPAILHARHSGYANFAIWNYGEDNQKIDLLVNTIGNYDGYLAVDFLDREMTTRFAVTADGPWQLDLLPLESAEIVDVPGTISHAGDYVFWLRSRSKADLLKAQSSPQMSNFAVYAYSKSGGRDLVINEIAPYSGTVPIAPDTFLVVVTAEGQWTLEFTAR